MTEATTITDGGSSPTETQEPEVVREPIFLDAPEPEDTEPIKPEVHAAAEPEKKDLDSRYDKDPEFKKRIDEIERKANEKAEARIRELESRTGNDQTIKQLMDKINALEGKLTPKQEEKLDFKPLQSMTPEELREWRDEDPVGYEQNRLKQFIHEVMQRLPKNDPDAAVNAVLSKLTLMGKQAESKKTAEAQKEAITKFADDHPDMEDLVPQIMALREKEPWRDSISAYWEIKGTGPDFGSKVKEAVEKEKQKWLKEGAEKVTPSLKPGASTQRSSPTEIKRRPNETDESLVARRVAARMAK